MKNRFKKTINKILKIFTLVLAILFLIFSILSGAEQQGGGLMGIIKNSPNALPWLALLIVVLISWKKSKLGGILFIILSIILTFFFHTYRDLTTFLIISLPLLVSGSLFVITAEK